MNLYQIKDGYRYNSDSMFLYAFALNSNIKNDVLDVGSGCGVIGLLLKRDLPNINLTLLELQEQNIEIIKKNSSINSLKCKILQMDFKEFKSEQKFDFIVSNPPFYQYYGEESQNLHKNISRYSKNLSLKDFIEVSNSHLKPQGTLVFCYDARQISEICILLKKYKLNLSKLQFVYPKEGKDSMLILIEAKKSSKAFCKILNPIFILNKNEYTNEAKNIFKKADLVSFDI